jgi:hypothetical protein
MVLDLRMGTSSAISSTIFEFDGQYVTDYAGTYCAVGEAINEPGGYSGADLGALGDCQGGGFEARIPFTLATSESETLSSVLLEDRGSGWTTSSASSSYDHE